MSVRLVSMVLRDSDAQLARRLILIALADAASDDGICWPNQDTIASKTRLAKTHVSETVTRMAEEGLIEVRKAQRGRVRINVYRVVLDGVDEPDYDRLPFDLSEPFTTSEIPKSSNGDGFGSTELTGSDLQGLRARVPFPDPKESTPKETVARIYAHWRSARGKTHARYNTISPKRLAKIKTRLKEFTEDDLIRAIDGVAKDPWPERCHNDDLELIFRSRDQVEKFLDLADRIDVPVERRRMTSEERRSYSANKQQAER